MNVNNIYVVGDAAPEFSRYLSTPRFHLTDTPYISEDHPTVTAPGVRIVSARAAGITLSPLSVANDATGGSRGCGGYR